MRSAIYTIQIIRKILALFAITVLFLSGCDDSDESKNEVLYTDLVPDIEFNYLKSVSRYNTFPGHECYNYTIIPSDTSINYSIDIDKDNSYDFLFNVNLYSYIDDGWGSSCGSTESFGSRITIKSYDDKDSIYVYHTYPWKNDFNNYGDSIQNNIVNAMWTTEWDFYLNGYWSGYEYDDVYIMVKKRNNFGWINISSDDERGYTCTFIIKGFAISLIEDIPIFAGQVE